MHCRHVLLILTLATLAACSSISPVRLCTSPLKAINATPRPAVHARPTTLTTPAPAIPTPPIPVSESHP